jgi:HSP90 family molecular chaperone
MQAESLGTVMNLLTELIYVEPGQFVLEFLQNAEDALLEAGRTGYFKVELYGDKVINK